MSWVLLLAGLYVLVVAAMFVFQRRLIFVGWGLGRGAPVATLEGVEVDWLERADGGGRFRVARGTPDAPPRALLLWFLGNGEDLRSGVGWAAVWRGYGLASVIVEYPGYGDSDGEPGIESVRAAADAALADAAERAAALGLPLFAGGYSLGAFPAVRCAASGPVAKLLLAAPATSLAAAARHRFPWAPVGLVLRHRFDSIAHAPQVDCPTLILHGDADPIIPARLGRALAGAVAGPTEFVEAEGYGHVLPLEPNGPFGARIRRFLVDR